MIFADDIFSILGTDIPILIGRKNLLNEVITHLNKENPEHLSIIGPKYIGKTVLLAAIDKHIKSNQKYFFSVYLDLHHNLPNDDRNFFQLLTCEILSEIKKLKSEYAQVLDPDSEHPFDQLRTFCGMLNDEGKSFVIILDGIDNLLKSGNITRNLWDNLRGIAQLRSIKLLTGSRKRLRELCSSPESKTSDFWGIFYPSPKVIGSYTVEDFESVFNLLKSKGINFDKGAVTEFINWTGGHPLLVSLFTRKIIDSIPREVVLSNQHINILANEVYPSNYQDHIEALWDDCTLEEKGILSDLALNGDSEIQDDNKKLFESLRIKGFILEEKDKRKLSSRFIEKIAKEKSKQITNLRLAFGNKELYSKNIKNFLDLRYSQMLINNSELSDRLGTIIDDVIKPLVCITQFRGFADYLMDEVIQVEMPSRQVPKNCSDKWLKEWENKGKIGPEPFAGSVPSERGLQLVLLKKMSESKFLSKITSSTIAGLESLNKIGNYGQHLGNSSLTQEFIVPYVLLALEVTNQFISESK